MTTQIINIPRIVGKWVAANWQDDIHPSQTDRIAQILSDQAIDAGYGYGADCTAYLETITRNDIISITDMLTHLLPEYSDEQMEAMYAEIYAEQEWYEMQERRQAI